jgi:hypothetical protein
VQHRVVVANVVVGRREVDGGADVRAWPWSLALGALIGAWMFPVSVVSWWLVGR